MRKRLGFLVVAAACASALLAACGGGGGHAGDTGPSHELRMSPWLEAAALPVGHFADLAVISQGVKPYHAWSSDAAVDAELLGDGTLRVTALAPGQAEVWVQDSSLRQSSLSLLVSSTAMALTSSVGSAINLRPDQSRVVDIGGGSAPHAVVSTDESVASIYGDAGRYVVTAHHPGQTTLLVTDIHGQTLQISVTVHVGTLALAPAQGSGVIGSRLRFTVSGGVAPYAASVLNPSIAGAVVSASVVEVALLAAGETQVAVSDGLGTTVLFGVTARASRLAINPDTRTVLETQRGGSLAYAISGDAPPFQAFASSADRAFVTGARIADDQRLMTVTLGQVLCLSGGDRSIQVLVVDAQGSSAVATVLVRDQGKDEDGSEIPC